MYTLSIHIEGKRLSDLDYAVEEISKQLKKEFLSGADSGEDGNYHFVVTGEPVIQYSVLVNGKLLAPEDETFDLTEAHTRFDMYLANGEHPVALWSDEDDEEPIREVI